MLISFQPIASFGQSVINSKNLKNQKELEIYFNEKNMQCSVLNETTRVLPSVYLLPAVSHSLASPLVMM